MSTATSALPGTVTVDTEVLIEVAAEMRAHSDLMVELNGGQETPASEHWGLLANRLLIAAGAAPDGSDAWYTDPLRVEAYARGYTAAAERFGELGSNADDYRNMATKARSTGDALAWTEEA